MTNSFMTTGKWLFTSESVTEGHPDKLCDQVSDAVLDALLAKDPMARVACETMTTTGTVIVAGEITTTAYADVIAIVREVVRDIGYTNAHYGFDYETCGVLTAIKPQSPDIAQGVDRAQDDNAELGAGDQGMMFGFAIDETPELMPLPITLAHAVAKRLAAVRKSREIPYLRPDGKTQITVEYQGGAPKRVHTVVVATQHDDGIDLARIQRDVKDVVVRGAIPEHLLDADTRYVINGTGKFVIGGPMGDAGLTGRKI
ncbi:MAG TPA: methionine adenosyltransferase, partial [Verrucomicrobiae bacterium]|nr:methionine adenosyltransferase [Verrucomicrobiae bacterium]